MSRPPKKLSDKVAQAKHDARLAARRERSRNRRTLELATKAAEGQADFAALLDKETQRIEQIKAAGAKSPKVTEAARDNLAAAFEYMGGVPALVVWGRQNPTEFYRIWARLIPKEAVEAQTALPLETLLSKLAEKEEMSVAQAAIEIGHETMEAARDQVALEDLISAEGKTIQ